MPTVIVVGSLVIASTDMTSLTPMLAEWQPPWPQIVPVEKGPSDTQPQLRKEEKNSTKEPIHHTQRER